MHAYYVLISLFVSIALAFRSDRRFLSFSLAFWILAQPVLTYKYIIDIPGISMALQPNRILLLTFAAYLAGTLLLNSGSQKTAVSRVPFEKYLYMYLFVVFISLIINYGSIRPQDILVISTETLTFIAVYLVTKNNSTEDVLASIINAVIILSVTGAIIAIIQFGVDKEFLRSTDSLRTAFGSTVRSTGIFQSEYDFGPVQVMGIMAIIIRYKKSVIPYILVPLIAISIVLTFHRMDFLILAICGLAYFLIFTNAKRKALTSVVIALSLVIGMAVYPIISNIVKGSALSETVQGRVSETSTITGRFKQFEIVAKYVFTDYTLVGFGSYENKAYDELMIGHGLINLTPDGRKLGYRVHNGYLQVGVLHGPVAMFLFTLFLLSMLKYFMGKSESSLPYAALSLFPVLIWMLMNLSNGLSSFNVYFALLLAIFSGAFVNRFQHNKFTSEQEKITDSLSDCDEYVQAKNTRILHKKKVL